MTRFAARSLAGVSGLRGKRSAQGPPGCYTAGEGIVGDCDLARGISARGLVEVGALWWGEPDSGNSPVGRMHSK